MHIHLVLARLGARPAAQHLAAATHSLHGQHGGHVRVIARVRPHRPDLKLERMIGRAAAPSEPSTLLLDVEQPQPVGRVIHLVAVLRLKATHRNPFQKGHVLLDGQVGHVRQHACGLLIDQRIRIHRAHLGGSLHLLHLLAHLLHGKRLARRYAHHLLPRWCIWLLLLLLLLLWRRLPPSPGLRDLHADILRLRPLSASQA
mmetsp:Transcript_51/g.86  ORF Transcript_51/g.86 Transcript_51/m.86 type:complete len:201 (-) Transcript_51:543-1145(-)